MKMKWRQKRSSLIALQLFIILSFLSNSRGQECGPGKVEKCVEPLNKYFDGNIDGLGNLPQIRQELESFCQTFKQVVDCAQSIIEKCLSEEEKRSFPLDLEVFKPIKETFCETGPLQESYLRHASCIKELKPEILHSVEIFKGTLKAIMRETQIGSSAAGATMTSLCGAMRTYFDCTYDTVQSKCGEEAGNFAKSYLDKYLKVIMSQLKKNSPNPNMYNVECAYINGSTSVGISLIQLTLILLVAYFT